MSSDGADMAAALQTIYEIGDHDALDRAVERAFPGSSLEIVIEGSRFQVGLRQQGMLRPLLAPELSDGTLRYLLWCAALLTPRPPELMVLNEPETSLHPELLPPLARLIERTARETQVVVVSHSHILLRALSTAHGVELVKDLGETTVAGQGLLSVPPWHWGSR
jgi:predicted ATPase